MGTVMSPGLLPWGGASQLFQCRNIAMFLQCIQGIVFHHWVNHLLTRSLVLCVCSCLLMKDLGAGCNCTPASTWKWKSTPLQQCCLTFLGPVRWLQLQSQDCFWVNFDKDVAGLFSALNTYYHLCHKFHINISNRTWTSPICPWKP